MMNLDRRTLLTGSAAGGLLLLTGCAPVPNPGSPTTAGSAATTEASPSAGPEPSPDQTPTQEEYILSALAADTVLDVASSGALAVSQALFERAGTVIVVPAAAEAEFDPAAAHSLATQLGIALFEASPQLAAELDRLGTHTVISYLADHDFGERTVIAGTSTTAGLPALEGLPRTPRPSPNAAFTDTEALPHAVSATLASAGITPILAASGHPGETGASTAHARQLTGPAVALGTSFGDAERFSTRLKVTRTAAELPGGGVLPFPGRRMIALYGHPGAPVLGMMGEQPPAEAVERVQKLVAQYRQHLPGETVIGAFEIITTIASGAAGDDGNYSILSSFERVLPYIEAAEANDIYVVLDLQPGRSTFLEQAKRYEDLLKRPWVGLALDPEWRLLTPSARHLKQIGQVGIDEVNEVSAWLSDLVRANNLPPKVLTLHQFQPRMIVERERLDTSRDEVQHMVHVDGLGGQGAKQATWARIKEDLPAGVFLGWKNFEDEDLPMLTPQQTVEQVEPLPHFISYQ